MTGDSVPRNGADLNAILNHAEFTHPVELVDIEAIRQALGNMSGLEVYHRIREVVVRVRHLNYERTLRVAGAPPMVTGGAK